MKPKAARPRKERAANAARRRQQIVAAAIESVSRYGLSGTTLATVAALAGMSQGSTVFYFQTKDQLLAAAFRAHCAEYREAWMKVFLAPSSDPVEHLTAFMLVDFSKKVCNRREISLWFDFWGETQSRPHFREIYEELSAEQHAHTEQLVDAALPLAPDCAWSSEGLVMALGALTDGLWLQFHMSRGPVLREGAREVLAEFLATVFSSHRQAIYRLAGKE